MAIADVLEAVHAAQLDHGHHVEGVDGRVAPALVEEASALLQVLEELQVLRIAPQCERGQLEVVPEVELLEAAALPGHALVLQGHQLDQLGHMVVAERAVGLAYPLLDGAPQGGYGAHVLVERNGEAVGLVASDQLGKRVLADRTRKVDVRVEAQVVVVLERELVAEEEAAEVAAHQVIGDHVAARQLSQRVVEADAEASLGNDARHPPVARRYEAELDPRAGAIEHGALELVRERLVVDEHVGVVEAGVELALELVEREQERAQVAVARQDEDAGVNEADDFLGRRDWWMMNRSDFGLPRSAQLDEHERQVDAYHRDDQIFVAKSHYALDMSRQACELCCLHFLFRAYMHIVCHRIGGVIHR